MRVPFISSFSGGARRWMIALAAGALCAAAPMAHAGTVVVNVKFDSQYPGYQPSMNYAVGTDPMFPSATTISAYYAGTGAASDPGTFWNGLTYNYAVIPEPPYPGSAGYAASVYTVNNPTESDGVTSLTGVMVQAIGDGGFVDGSANTSRASTNNLLGSYSGSGGVGGGPGYFVVTGLNDNAAYSLYLYGGPTTYSITNGIGGTVINSASTTGNSGSSSNNASLGSLAGGNWVDLTGTASATGEIDGTFTGSLAGLQLVETVPEPTSLSLLGVAGLGLLARRRRA